MVYLIHFDRPYFHAKHYLGSTDLPISERMERHRSGAGSKLTAAVAASNIEMTVVRTWQGGRTEERALKRAHNSPRLCPKCNPRRNP